MTWQDFLSFLIQTVMFHFSTVYLGRSFLVETCAGGCGNSRTKEDVWKNRDRRMLGHNLCAIAYHLFACNSLGLLGFLREPLLN